MLGQQHQVRFAGDAGMSGDPAGVAAHHLDDEDAPVRGRRRVQPVDGVAGRLHRGVEAERLVGAGDVVVDRLGQADDPQAAAVEPVRGRQRALAADGDERVEAELGEAIDDQLLFALVERIVATRAQLGAAAHQPAVRALAVERHGVALLEPEPRAPDTENVQAEGFGPEHTATDDGIDAWRIAAAGEDADSFHDGNDSVENCIAGRARSPGAAVGRTTRATFEAGPGATDTGAGAAPPRRRLTVGLNRSRQQQRNR